MSVVQIRDNRMQKFRIYMDRIIKGEEDSSKEENIDCPVCGCGECQVGK